MSNPYRPYKKKWLADALYTVSCLAVLRIALSLTEPSALCPLPSALCRDINYTTNPSSTFSLVLFANLNAKHYYSQK